MLKKHRTFKIIGLLPLFLLSACQNTPTVENKAPVNLIEKTSSSATTELPALKHAYDFHIIDTQHQQPLSVHQLTKQLTDYDVVFIGEFHGNHASHLVQMRLVSELHQLRPEQTLSLEMFNRDQQTILNRYLDGEIGEIYLTRKAPAWHNYVASYRPLVEYAKQHFIPVVAANASADIVRCIGREGKPYLDKLSEQERAYVAQSPFIDNEAYRTRYMEFLEKARKLSDEDKEKSYLAQLSRDNTMAESIYQARLETPGAQIIHLNGSFHSDFYLGTVASLKARDQSLKIAVISPVMVEDANQSSYSDEDLSLGQYIYLVQPEPEQYVDRSYRQKNHHFMFQKAREKSCRPDEEVKN